MSSIGKVVKTYEVNVAQDEITYTHSVHIGDEMLQARHTMTRAARFVGGPPVEYVDRMLQHDIMQAIKARIYGGQQ